MSVILSRQMLLYRLFRHDKNLICLNTPVPGQGPVMLSPGIHSFPFKLGLPLGLPSTFLGKHGWVQYFCKAALRETNGLTHKNQQVFIVMNPIDLNLEPNLLAVSYLDGFSVCFRTLEFEFLFWNWCRKKLKIAKKVNLLTVLMTNFNLWLCRQDMAFLSFS